jgi:hypothetical protein
MIQKYYTRGAKEQYEEMRRTDKRIGRNLDHTMKHADCNGLILNETPVIMNRWKLYFQDLLGGSEMEVSHMRKETEQETKINEVEEMPNENEYLTI